MGKSLEAPNLTIFGAGLQSPQNGGFSGSLDSMVLLIFIDMAYYKTSMMSMVIPHCYDLYTHMIEIPCFNENHQNRWFHQIYRI